ncbi:sulfite oxidase [Devosia nitrariae]|uniref:Sulfite oxidase n=1 Tax=Devosia nitrariae TaxID=2071872 RepID=A0ABQ5W783_9HYPH|nr:sulfite oxidase [Devosia nitrariae]GLQ55486.1 sulfite oxidase [Devosia nitrariae]
MDTPVVHRRHFLIGAAGVAVASTVPGMGGLAFAQEAIGTQAPTTPLPDYASWKKPEAMIVHTELTLETRRPFIGTSSVVPSNILFVRNNLEPPDSAIVADADAWEVAFEGVAQPRTMTVRELKQLGIATVPTVLQCSGNGRGLFDHEASGSPWLTGAAGCVVWSGVPLRAVVDALGGVAEGARFVTNTGGEVIPEGIDANEVLVERSVPIENVDTIILAWEMNGEPVPLAHGGPLRVIVPGYYGVNNVKYVKRIAFTEAESEADIQQTGYRVRPVGESGAPDQPSMWQMKVKSWVTHPVVETPSGPIQIHGVAFGGINPVQRVEVSTDDGQSWQEAQLLDPDLGRYAWRSFVLPVELPSGTYSITSRATDSEGNVQEQTTEPNHRGYDYSGWDRLAVEVTVL